MRSQDDGRPLPHFPVELRQVCYCSSSCCCTCCSCSYTWCCRAARGWAGRPVDRHSPAWEARPLQTAASRRGAAGPSFEWTSGRPLRDPASTVWFAPDEPAPKVPQSAASAGAQPRFLFPDVSTAHSKRNPSAMPAEARPRRLAARLPVWLLMARLGCLWEGGDWGDGPELTGRRRPEVGTRPYESRLQAYKSGLSRRARVVRSSSFDRATCCFFLCHLFLCLSGLRL